MSFGTRNHVHQQYYVHCAPKSKRNYNTPISLAYKNTHFSRKQLNTPPVQRNRICSKNKISSIAHHQFAPSLVSQTMCDAAKQVASLMSNVNAFKKVRTARYCGIQEVCLRERVNPIVKMFRNRSECCFFQNTKRDAGQRTAPQDEDQS